MYLSIYYTCVHVCVCLHVCEFMCVYLCVFDYICTFTCAYVHMRKIMFVREHFYVLYAINLFEHRYFKQHMIEYS